MKKIVELIIKMDDLELEGVGQDAIAFVENPAIELDFLAFAEEKFVKPNAGETEEEFIGRCIPELMGEGYEQEQSIAICYNYWQSNKFNTPEQDKEMVDGIIDLLLQVEDIENRREIAWETIQQFIEEGTQYDLQDFMTRIGLQTFEFPEGTCWEGYEPYGTKILDGKEVPNCIPVEAQKFESYNDYPESAKAAAKRALEWRDANPDQDCGTPVGWARANQLAKGENISEETIARMASFARHLQYKDVPYSEGCGGLMVDAWGGQAGIEWAQNKLEAIREEKFGINPGNLAPYVDQTGDLKKKEEMSEEQQQIVDYFASCGEEYDPQEAIFVKIKDNTFSDFTDLLDGVAALDILGRTLSPQQTGETVFRYAGPRAERGFCRAMLRLNRVYRPNEITGLNTANPGFGPGGTDEYSVLKYAGGPNCRHYWEELTMFKQDGRHVFINKGPVTATTQGGRGMSAADLTAAGQSKNMNAPSATGSVANNAYLAPRNLFSFSTNEEQRIATGAAMIPNKMILRKDENGNPYYVYFTEKTIRDIAEKVFEENKHNMTNIEHRSSETNTLNTLLESWIVEDPEMDKSKALGFSVPKGTWMVSYRVNDDKTWEMIKEGKLKGFSVEGYFIEKAEAARAQKAMEQMYADILNILKEVK